MNGLKIAAVACLATCAANADGVVAVDWSSVDDIYTVPADTTNEITTAEDFTYFTNRVKKVIFGNVNSTLRFGVSTYPKDMLYGFEGYGTVLMSEKVLLSADTVLKHTNGNIVGDKALRFVFEQGIDSNDGATTYKLDATPDGTCFFNAIVSILGPVKHVSPVILNFTRVDVGENAYFETGNRSIGYNGRYAMVRQRGGVVAMNSYYIGERYDSQVAYLMEGGIFTNKFSTIYNFSNYLNFR